QIDPNHRALTGLTGRPDLATVLFYYSVHHGQTQTSCMPEGFGSKERLEGTIQRPSIHSCTGVRNGEQHVVTRDEIVTRAGLRVELIETDVLNRYRQPPP